MSHEECRKAVPLPERSFTAIERRGHAVDPRSAEIDGCLSGAERQLVELRRDMNQHFGEVIRRLERLLEQAQTIRQLVERLEALLTRSNSPA